MQKQTSAFERLWHWTNEASKIYRSKDNIDASDLYAPLLDINQEGKLDHEIKDIIEELDIIIPIMKTQKDILTKLIGYATEKLEPSNRDSYEWFKRNADERFADVNDWIKKLEELRSTAESTANSVSIFSILNYFYISVPNWDIG